MAHLRVVAITVLLVLSSLHTGLADTPSPFCANGTSTDVSKPLSLFRSAFPNISVPLPIKNTLLGRENQTACCILAIDEYLRGGCKQSGKTCVDNSLFTDEHAQFPCGGDYIGNSTGAPEVHMRYDWAASNCPGWQRSAGSDVNQWALLVAGFLLPPIVYSFNIPRPGKLRLRSGILSSIAGSESNRTSIGINYATNTRTRSKFRARSVLCTRYAFYLLCHFIEAILAAMIVLIDVIMWFIVVFAFAGPILLSTIVEACLDIKVLNFLQNYPERNRLPLGLRYRMLLTVLTGNLRLRPAWSHTMDLAKYMDDLDRQNFAVGNNQQQGQNIDPGDKSKTMQKMGRRLRAMLASQQDYGSTLAGPIVFFLGSFIYAFVELKGNFGNEDVAEALAFGMWWFVLPHIASISGVLLAGNNPNILEGIVNIRHSPYVLGDSLLNDSSLQTDATHVSKTNVAHSSNESVDNAEQGASSYFDFLESVYGADYVPVWIWVRGRCKLRWLLVLFTDSWFKYPQRRPLLKHLLMDALMLDTRDWFLSFGLAFLLLAFPFIFAFSTSYFQPPVGLGCRSLTFLVYISAQLMLLLWWVYYLTQRDKYWIIGQRLKHYLATNPNSDSNIMPLIEQLKDQATRDTSIRAVHHDAEERARVPASNDSVASNMKLNIKRNPTMESLFWVLCLPAFLVSLFTVVAGTLMQIMGVYRNNLCLMTVPYWRQSVRANTWITISTNTRLAIDVARRDWDIIGTCSSIFLGGVCYAGWWHQKRLRTRFKSITNHLGDN